MYVLGTKIIFYYHNIVLISINSKLSTQTKPESNCYVHESTGIISNYYPMCTGIVTGEVIGFGVHDNIHAVYQIQTIDLSYLKVLV